MTTTPDNHDSERANATGQPEENSAAAHTPEATPTSEGVIPPVAQPTGAAPIPQFLAPEVTPPAMPQAPPAYSPPQHLSANDHAAQASGTQPPAPQAPAQNPSAQHTPAQHISAAQEPALSHPQPGHLGAPQYAAAQHLPSAGATQPTVQLDAPAANGGSNHGGAGNGASFGAASVSDGTPQATHSAQPKNRTGALLAGLAIGALLGGVVGGGVAAVVASNSAPQSVAQGASSITLNNAENATAISGVAAVATPSVVTLEVSSSSASGSGSGVIYSEDGYIITNAHVVTLDGAALDNATVRVKLSDGRILDGTVVGVDPYADLAVVKVEADSLPAVQVADSNKLDVGDLTVAIGAPLNLANTVTSGVVSALNRGISVGSPLIPQDPTQDPNDGGNSEGDQGFPWDFRFGLPDNNGQQQEPQQQQQSSGGGTVTLPVIQTDASINPGNSGGALLNGKGELIGINVAIASAASSGGTAGSDGLGFAIPANLATRVADAIIAGEQPSHGLLGASVADSSQDTDEDANHAGGLLVEVVKGGAADKAGLKAGDVITAVDGVAAVDGTSVSALIRMHEGGSTISIDYTRGGKPGEVEAKLGNLEW